MSQDHDKQFFNTFAIVIGILVGITLVIIALANMISARSIDADNARNPYAQQMVVERIKPAGEVAVAGGAHTSGGGVVKVAAGAEDLGKKTYEQACFACHGTGAAGAPRVGDAADWGERRKQGRDVLIAHSIEGFMGKKGYMPPKGGQTHLADEAVIAALDYMLETSK